MVKIKRGDHETLVSMDSYNNIFKPLGYILVEDKKITTGIGKSKVEITPEKIKATIEETKTLDTKKKKRQED